jgi:hypothetical protein
MRLQSTITALAALICAAHAQYNVVVANGSCTLTSATTSNVLGRVNVAVLQRIDPRNDWSQPGIYLLEPHPDDPGCFWRSKDGGTRRLVMHSLPSATVLCSESAGERIFDPTTGVSAPSGIPIYRYTPPVEQCRPLRSQSIISLLVSHNDQRRRFVDCDDTVWRPPTTPYWEFYRDEHVWQPPTSCYEQRWFPPTSRSSSRQRLDERWTPPTSGHNRH